MEKKKVQWKHYLSSNLLSKYQQWPLKSHSGRPLVSTTRSLWAELLSWRISWVAVLPPWWGISSWCWCGDAASKQKELWKHFFFFKEKTRKTLLQGLLCLGADPRAAKPWSDENRPTTSHFIWLGSRQGSVLLLVQLSQRGAALTAQHTTSDSHGRRLFRHFALVMETCLTKRRETQRPRRCTHRC